MSCASCESTPSALRHRSWRCAFDGPTFRNYMCGTLDALREVLRPVQYEFKDLNRRLGPWFHMYRDDDHSFIYITNQHGAFLNLELLDVRSMQIVWYKDRGATEQIWVLDSESLEMRRPTEGEIIAVTVLLRETLSAT